MHHTVAVPGLFLAAQKTPWSEVDMSIVWVFFGLMALLILALVFWRRRR